MKIPCPRIGEFIAKLQGSDLANIQNDSNADVPIRSSGQDLLRRAAFAGRIAQILSGSRVAEGRVFTIRGAWGEGKSSLKNLIIERLAENKSSKWLEFNPWQWGDSDAVARALFSQMAGKLGGTQSAAARKRASTLRKYGAILVGGSKTLRSANDEKVGLSSWVAAIAIGLGAVGQNLPKLQIASILPWILMGSGALFLIGKALNIIGRDRSAEALDEVRTDLERRLAQLPCPLVVFVDDIDRLEKEQIRLLFRHIKVNANLPNIIFVLLYQPNIVEAALDEIVDNEGRAYLEKIVQANFDLPSIPKDRIYRIFTEQLSETVGSRATAENGFEQVRWGNVWIGGMQPFVSNLRDARRLLSSIEAHIPLHEGDRVFEVNIIDLLALETLRVFEPDFHAAIANSKSLLLQSNRYSSDRRNEADKEAVQAIIDLVRPEHREHCTDLLKQLFPTIEWALGGSHYSGESWAENWMREKRVCAGQSFDRYFELQLPEGALSESAFVNFCEGTADPVALSSIIEEMASQQLLPALATRLDLSVKDLPIDNLDALLPAMFDLGERVLSGGRGPFNSPLVSIWRAALWYLSRVEPASKRLEHFLCAMSNSRGLAVPATLISLEMPKEDGKERGRHALFDEEDIPEVAAAWVEKMRARAEDDQAMLGDDELVAHLYRWSAFAGDDAGPRAWVARMAAQDASLLALLQRFVAKGTSHGWGDRVARPTKSFHKSSLEGFFDLPELEQRIRALDRRSLPADVKETLEIFDWHVARWAEGKSTD